MKSFNNSEAAKAALPNLDHDLIKKKVALEKMRYGEVEYLLGTYNAQTLARWIPYTLSQLDDSWHRIYHAKYLMAEQLIIPEVLVHDDNWVIRSTLARKGYAIDALKHDRKKRVRKEAEKYVDKLAWSKRILNNKS